MAVLKIEPGLSWYKDAPQRAAASLAQLVRFAEAHVPPTAHASTPIHVFSTAGLRMLPERTRSAIEREVRQFLSEQSTFLLRENSVQVIPGHREALFVWIAANYGLGKLSSSDDATLGCLDMGGASAQVAYEVPPTHVSSSSSSSELAEHGAVDPLFTVQSVWGRKVYAGTLDGFGANEARRRYVDALHHNEHVKPGDVGTDPCLPPGLIDEQRRPSGGVISLVGTGDFDQCFERSVPLLRSKNLKHSFSDTILPHPAHPSAPWLGISEFWYTMDDVYNIGGTYNAVQFRQKARVFCGTEWATLSREHAQGLYPKAKPHRMKYQCFKSAWLRAMLHEGYRFPTESEFSSTSVINNLPVQVRAAAIHNHTSSSK
jgi:Golgi nucleoside diphosphatase